MASPLLLLLSLLLLSTIPSSSPQSTCKNYCGSIPIHYPFGTGPGCGSPLFTPHVTCQNLGSHQLTFTSNSGSYPIQSVDYTNQLIILSDPTMSTCASTNPSSGFSLDWDAPFTFVDGDIFALLDCSPTSSLFTSNSTPLCDTTNAPICSLLYSCPAISQLNAPISTCCVYTPASLGPAFEMDLSKLECGSYSAVHGFNGAESNPGAWEFGVALKYRFSVDDGFPSACADCEKSGGMCGYVSGGSGGRSAFTCTCGNGMNSSTNCYFASQPWNGANRDELWIGLHLILSWGLLCLFFM